MNASFVLACWLLQASDERVVHQVIPSIDEMMGARTDVWGEAALRQPGGPSFEFFRDLLPPLRYVNTAFRHYPIVLSAPRAAVKARWVSDGSAVNARANQKPMWRELGVPVHFFVGANTVPFGEHAERLSGPRYERGYLPLVQIAYSHDGVTYGQEAFASVDPVLAEWGVVFVRFTAGGAAGKVTVRLDALGSAASDAAAVLDERGGTLVNFDRQWHGVVARREWTATLPAGGAASLAVWTRPGPGMPPLTEPAYDRQRQDCLAQWQSLLDRGIQIEIPEPLVNDAGRSVALGNFVIASGDRMNYSAGNAYDHLYEAECGDAVRAMMLFGWRDESLAMVGPLLAFERQATRFHVAGHKLQLLAHTYWLTRDATYIRQKEPVWRPVVEFIRSSRQPNGLLPKDNYAGDIAQQVYSLNSNANCWRGLRDMAVVLADMGDEDSSRRLAGEAESFRQSILDAVAASERRAVRPPFIPIALLSDEPAHDPLTATRMGSYYDLMAPYVIGSGVFGPNSERETGMIEYLQQHGGIAMGMIRSQPHQGQFAGQPGVNVLYGLRYMLALLRRDDRERALVGFYGQLAQAMTRDTFIGAEGTRFAHGDRLGRSMYLPPNSASNAMFLTTLRYLLIQDWDLDDDGRPETLRLLYAIPRRWLADGATIRVGRAPTMFGPISLAVESRLSRGEVRLLVTPPSTRPRRLLVRLPVPAGYRVVSAVREAQRLDVRPDGSIELPADQGRMDIHVRVLQE